MYVFSNDELEVLNDAKSGSLQYNTAEHDFAFQVFYDNLAIFYSSDPISDANRSAFAHGLLEDIINNNAGYTNAAFYDATATILMSHAEGSDVVAWLQGAAKVNREEGAASDFIREFRASELSTQVGAFLG